ncbi:MAG TPA: outer membrane beta-barrel protein [Gemmatimonadales bacterium]|nr:outer membrane beta-barrel protein [Gemmatimonadales bacterium]
MRYALWGLLACGLARTAAAQDVTFQDARPLTVSGFAVGAYAWDRNARTNSFAGSKIALSLFRPWSDHLYLFAQLTTALLTDETTGEPITEIEIDNLLVSWTPPGATALSIDFGRFDAPIGFERDDEPLNLIPTSSFTFELARPGKLTGVVARYAVSPTVGVAGYVANGWEVPLDNNRGKTAGVRVDVFPAEGVAVGLNALYGPEVAGTDAQQRTLIAADATLQPLSALIIGVEGNFGRELVGGGAAATWTGLAGTAFYRLGQSFGLSVRAETLRDKDGLLSGTVQTLQSLTISPWYFYREAQEGIFSNVEHTSFRLPAFSLRPALRIDHSNQAVFPDADGSLRDTNLLGVVELVYLF